MPTLETLRTKFRANMSRDEFFEACDELLEQGPLRIGSPAASPDLVSIHVDEGGEVLFFLTGGRLQYAEYQGGVFLGE